MFSETRYGTSPKDIAGYTNERLRDEYLMQDLFVADEIRLVYSHIDRMIVGACVPVEKTIELSSGEALGTKTFFSAREMGIANLGGGGTLEVDGLVYEIDNRDVFYVGRGVKSVKMSSTNPANPAAFYMNSVPAGQDIPCALIKQEQSKPVTMGDDAHANKRTLRMYIHPEVSPSCLLLMGITQPAPGSVWNTHPPHLHERRMEAYVYFDMVPEDRVMHFMGEPSQVRPIVIANREAVLSPSWSIHMGVGTGPYAFVWGMTGENKAYTDSTPVAVKDLI